MDSIDALGSPSAVTLAKILSKSNGDFFDWLNDRNNRRAIPHKLENCGYIPIRNPDCDDGLWVVGKKRQVVYAKTSLPEHVRMVAVRKLVAETKSP